MGVSQWPMSKSRQCEKGKRQSRCGDKSEDPTQPLIRTFTVPDLLYHPRDGHLQTALATIHVHMRPKLNPLRGRDSPPVEPAVARPPSKLTNRMRDQVYEMSRQYQHRAQTHYH